MTLRNFLFRLLETLAWTYLFVGLLSGCSTLGSITSGDFLNSTPQPNIALNDPLNRSDSQHTVDMAYCGYRDGLEVSRVKYYLACMDLKGYVKPQTQASQ